jgi:hypothetical protein
METQVTYLCWGCGSEKTQIDDVGEPLPSLTIWNLCPDCTRRKDNNNEKTLIKEKEAKNG